MSAGMVGDQFEDFVALPGELYVVQHGRDVAGHGAFELYPAFAAGIAVAQRQPLGRRQAMDADDERVQSRLSAEFKTLLQNWLSPDVPALQSRQDCRLSHVHD